MECPKRDLRGGFSATGSRLTVTFCPVTGVVATAGLTAGSGLPCDHCSGAVGSTGAADAWEGAVAGLGAGDAAAGGGVTLAFTVAAGAVTAVAVEGGGGVAPGGGLTEELSVS